MGKSVIKKLILPGFIIFIMVMSGVGYMAGRGSGDIIKYNGHRFSKVQDGWLTYNGNQQIILINNPEDLVDIDVGFIDFNELNSASKIYLSTNPSDNLGTYLQGFKFNLLNVLSVNKISSCYEDNVGCENLPLKTCSDASESVKVFLVKKGETKIEYKDNCLLIQGKDEKLIKYIDKMILRMFVDGS